MSDSTSERTPHDRHVDALIAEIELAIEQGRPLKLEEFLKPHPEHAADVRKYFEDAGLLRKAIQPFQPGPEETEPITRSIHENLKRGTTVRYFGDYEIQEELGSGGMGVVYKARQTKLKRLVALKMIKRGQFASEEDVKRFQAEAQAAAKLDHAGIVRVIEVGLHHGEHYYAMDYVASGNLSSLYREQPVAARHAAELVKKLAEAMHYAHGQGIVHRDLKPANVLLTTNGTPRITDFGLAKRLPSGDDSTGATMTETGQVLGTAGYMSPEQAAGKTSLVGPQSDVYSLGAILYALLTSRAPFVGDSPSVTILQVINNEPVALRALNPSVPHDLETICLKCLEKEPHKRYGTAQLLADDLVRFLENKPVLARPVTAVERTWRWCRRNPWAATALSLVLLVAVVSPLVATQLYRLATERELARSDASDKAGKLEISLVAESKALEESRWQVYRLRMMKMEQLWLEKDWGHLDRLLAESTPQGDEKDLRGWEWHYLKAQVEQRIWQPRGSTGKVIGLDWERKSGRLAVLRTGTLEIWLPRERRMLKSITVPPMLNGVDHILRWSPDQRHLAFSDNARRVHVIDTETEEIECTIVDPVFPEADGDYISYIDWCPLGEWVAVTFGHKCIRLWSIARTPVLIKTLATQDGITPQRIYWSHDKTTYTTTSCDGWVTCWKTADWSPIQQKRLVDQWCGDVVSWSPNGFRIAIASSGNPVVGDAEGKQTVQLANQGSNVRRVAWLDNHRLVTTNEAHEIRIVDTNQQAPDDVFRLHSEIVTALSVGPDNQIATATPEESFKVWSPNDVAAEFLTLTGTRLPSDSIGCDWHPQLNVLGMVSRHQERDVVATWSAGAPQVEIVPFTDGAKNVYWSQSGDRLIADTNNSNWVAIPWPLSLNAASPGTAQPTGHLYSFDGRFRVDAKQTERIEIIDTHKKEGAVTLDIDNVYACAWHPREPWLVLAQWDRILVCQPLQEQSAWKSAPQIHQGKFQVTRCLAWSRDGKQFFVGGNNGAIHIFDFATLEIVHTLRGHAGAVTSVAQCYDGTRIVTAGLDGFIRWWDGEKGVELFKIPISKSERICELHFSADSQCLAGRSESGQIYIWTVEANMPALARSAIGSSPKPLARNTAVASERTIANEVLRNQGVMEINGQLVTDIMQLPPGPLTIHSITLRRARLLNDELAEDLGRLTQAWKLDVCDSGFQAVQVQLLSKAKFLRELKICRCAVGDDAIAALSKLQQLNRLDMSDTFITSQGVAELRAMLPTTEVVWNNRTETFDTALTRRLLAKNARVTISMEEKRIELVAGESLPPIPFRVVEIKAEEKEGLTIDDFEGLEKLDALESINLLHTRVDDAVLAKLTHATNLRLLDFGNTKVTGKPLAQFEVMPNVTQVVFGGGLANESTSHFDRFPNLNAAYIGWTNLTDKGLENLPALKNLTLLSCGHNKIDGSGLATLSRFAKLHRLDLSYTLLTDDGLRNLPVLSELSELNVSATAITDASVSYLSKFESLTKLDLIDTAVTSSGIEELRKKLPRCIIEGTK